MADGDWSICVVPTGELISQDDERVPKMRWKSFSCASHPLVVSLNASCLKVSNSGRSLVMGDKQGTVKLFSFPPTSPGAHVSHNYDKIFCLKKKQHFLGALDKS